MFAEVLEFLRGDGWPVEPDTYDGLQVDLDSAELVFRSMLFISDGVAVPDGLCRGLVYCKVLTVDRCLPELKAAAAGEYPRRAYQRLSLRACRRASCHWESSPDRSASYT